MGLLDEKTGALEFIYSVPVISLKSLSASSLLGSMARAPRTAFRAFRKSPFWALAVVGLTPLPFYPIKFLSLSDGYPMKRYLAALVVGRTPRYYLIAYLGQVLDLPNWSLVTLALVILIVTLYKYYQQQKEQ